MCRFIHLLPDDKAEEFKKKNILSKILLLYDKAEEFEKNILSKILLLDDKAEEF